MLKNLKTILILDLFFCLTVILTGCLNQPQVFLPSQTLNSDAKILVQPVLFKNIANFSTLSLKIGFDSTVLELARIDSSLKPQDFILTKEISDNVISLALVREGENELAGPEILELKFKVKKTENTKLILKEAEVTDNQDKLIPVKLKNAEIEF